MSTQEKKWDVGSFEGTEAEVMKFAEEHKQDLVAVPYQATGKKWKVNYWYEYTGDKYARKG